MPADQGMKKDVLPGFPDDDLLEDIEDDRAGVSARRGAVPEGMTRAKPGPRKKLLYSKRDRSIPGSGATGHTPSPVSSGDAGPSEKEPGVSRPEDEREEELDEVVPEPADSVATGGGGPTTGNTLSVADAAFAEPLPVFSPDGEGLLEDKPGPAVKAAAAPPVHSTPARKVILPKRPGVRDATKEHGLPEDTAVPAFSKRKGLLKPGGTKQPGRGRAAGATSPPGQAPPDMVDVLVLEDDLLDDDDAPRMESGERLSHKKDATIVGDDLLDEGEATSPPVRRRLFGGLGKAKRDITPAPPNGKKPGLLSGIAGIFAKKVKGEMQSLPFFVGPLDEPSLEGALRDVNVTYPVNAPFQYVHIEYHHDEGALRYEVREPELSEDEQFALSIVEKGFEKMISTNLDMIAGGDREAYLKDRFLSICTIFGITATEEQKERMFFHLSKKYLGYSHMDTLMKDKYIEDISCNGSGINLYVMHRIYGSVQTNIQFAEVELNNFVLRLAQVGGRHISLLQPIRDVTLPDGSRANLTLGSEVTKNGSTFTIRKFRTNPISPIEMMDYGTIDARQLAYLWILMEYKRSILVSGGTATGKTTMLNVLCSFIPSDYKIVSIEDTAELNLLHPNWIQSVTRTGFGAGESSTASLSGVSGMSRRAPGDISLYDLLVAALRQRPEFIIVGEVRGDEAFPLFQAIAVGHAALGTIHAGSINELLARIESNPMNVPRALFSNLDAVIFPMHIMRGERSARRVANITEVLELDRDTGDLITNTSFKWAPDVDEFRFQGRTYLFDKIRDTYGISKDMLRTELENRVRFLQWLQLRGVKDYHQVIRMIRHYQRNRDLVLDRIRENGEVGDLLEAEVTGVLPVVMNGDGDLLEE